MNKIDVKDYPGLKEALRSGFSQDGSVLFMNGKEELCISVPPEDLEGFRAFKKTQSEIKEALWKTHIRILCDINQVSREDLQHLKETMISDMDKLIAKVESN